MALNYADRETLRPQIVSRCKESVRKYLLYLQGGGGSPSQARIDWCTANMNNLADLAEQVSHYVTSETAFIDGGSSITDAQIQGRVESVLNSFFLPA